MDNMGLTLQNLKEKTFVFAKKAFAMAVDDKIPRTQNTLLDENLMIKLGIKPTRVMSKRFAFAGISTRIVAEARFTTQTVLNGVPTGNTFLKVFVVRDLSLFYGVDAIAGGQLYTKLSSTQKDDSFTNSDAVVTPAKARPDEQMTPTKVTPKHKTLSKKLASPQNNSKTKPKVPQIFFRNLYPEMYSPGSPRPYWERSPTSSDARYSSPSSSCSSPTCQTASRRARTLSENHYELREYSDEDDTYDNIFRIVENEFGYEGTEGTVVQRVLPYPRPGILPPDFLPCGQNCALTSCGCLRRYSSWDFMS